MGHGTTSIGGVLDTQVEEEVNIAGGRESIHVTTSRQATTRGQQTARTYYRIRGSSGPDWDMPNNDIESVYHAIKERVFFTKDGNGGFKRAPKPWDHPRFREQPKSYCAAQDSMDAHFEYFNSQMSRLARSHGKESPLSDDEFLSCYGGSKLKIYAAAVESLRDRCLTKKDCDVKVFTKDEYRKPGGAPRAIQPRSPRFNVQLGRYVKNIEHKIFDAINEIFDPSRQHKSVAKGMNLTERGACIANMWDDFEDPIAVGLDASRFDQHINSMLLKHEHKIYHMWSKGHGDGLWDLNRLLQAQLLNKGKYNGKDGKIRYTVDGCRMSGDMNTSLGNVIIMCTVMHAYFRHKRLETQIKLLNDGDDCVIIMDRKNLDHFLDGLQEWFLEFGLTMEYDGIYDTLERVEFCQSNPVRFGNSYRMLPRPTKRLYSDLISTKELGRRKVYNKLVGAIAGCGLALSEGAPVFQAFYRWLARGANPWIPGVGDYYHKYRQELIDGMEINNREPTDDERISFYFAFDITPDEQRLIETHYNSLADPLYTPPIIDLPRQLDPIQCLVEPEQKDIN